MEWYMAVILGVIVALVVWRNKHLDKKQKEKEKKQRELQEAIEKANAEAWLTDYRNPDSPNYDPIAAEQALQELLDKLKFK